MKMAYPQAPWHLQGYALQTLHVLDISRVRPLIPSELEIVPIFPGKTLGGVYIAAYGTGSDLTYSELIVASGIIYHGGRLGSWISHIYVDNPDSVQGGREVWGLPKELAEFQWQHNPQPNVQVSQGDRILCRLNCKWHSPGIQLPIAVPTFSVLGQKLLQFKGHGTFNLQLAGLNLQVPSESPFAWLGIGQAWLGFYTNPMQLVADRPAIIQERASTFNYSAFD
jgi:acetoacetate decarboxylase